MLIYIKTNLICYTESKALSACHSFISFYKKDEYVMAKYNLMNRFLIFVVSMIKTNVKIRKLALVAYLSVWRFNSFMFILSKKQMKINTL